MRIAVPMLWGAARAAVGTLLVWRSKGNIFAPPTRHPLAHRGTHRTRDRPPREGGLTKADAAGLGPERSVSYPSHVTDGGTNLAARSLHK